MSERREMVIKNISGASLTLAMETRTLELEAEEEVLLVPEEVGDETLLEHLDAQTIASTQQTKEEKTKEASRAAIHRLATIAWLAIVLGLVMQALILAGKLIGGAPVPGLGLLAGVAQGVTWSLLVCIGVGVGVRVMRAPISLAGLIGFVSAPLALAGAKGVQRGVSELIGTPQGGFSIALLVIALIKAIEYGFLTLMLCRFGRKKREGLSAYLSLGALTGLVFGGLIVIISSQIASGGGSPLALPALIGLTINELLFPIGCAMVIYAVLYIGRHVKVIEAADK